MAYNRISNVNRIIIIALKEACKSVGDIQIIMKERYKVDVSKRGLQKLLKKFQETGKYEDSKRSGRPCKISQRGERIIRRISLKDRFLSARNVLGIYCDQTKDNISQSTLNRILNEYVLRSHTAVKKTLLNYSQRQRRLEWARDKKNWPISKWNTVVFSDESLFQTFQCSRKRRVRRFSNESLSALCTQNTLKHSPQVHVWGCFSSNGVGLIKRISGHVNAQKYTENIINDIDVIGKCLVFPEKQFIFQQDLAPPHRASSTKTFLEDMNVDLLDWPANSPDANPIENMWNVINLKLGQISAKTSDQLWSAIQDIWYKTSKGQCEKLISSMPRRMLAIVKSRGYPTKY